MWAHLECRLDEPVGHGTASPRFQEETMQYALLIYSASEALVALERLQSAETATSVRVRDGERLLTDGPFIETKEYLLGFYLIEAPNLDTALDWAARMPISRFGAVEVRPVLPTPTLTEITAN
jgi:hypothetical protein